MTLIMMMVNITRMSTKLFAFLPLLVLLFCGPPESPNEVILRTVCEEAKIGCLEYEVYDGKYRYYSCMGATHPVYQKACANAVKFAVANMATEGCHCHHGIIEKGFKALPPPEKTGEPPVKSVLDEVE